MVLMQKNFLEHEIEFIIQTDLIDGHGTVWQSTTCLSIPFQHDPQNPVPLSKSFATLDPQVMALPFKKWSNPHTFACTPHQLRELEAVSVTTLDGRLNSSLLTPMMWIMGRTAASLKQQDRIPLLPMLASFVLDDLVPVPLQSPLTCESSIYNGPEKKTMFQVLVTHNGTNVLTGLLRTVGWIYEEELEKNK